MRVRLLLPILCACFIARIEAAAIHYQLLYGSTLSYKIAGKTVGSSLLTGSFELRSPDSTLTNLHYAIDQIQFASFVTNSISGAGSFDVTTGGIASAKLDIVISDVSTQSIPFTNLTFTPDRKWPMIALRLQQTNSVNDRVYTINIRAAPFHDIWISSAAAFRADALPPPNNQISSGDLLSVTGRIVKRRAELSGNIDNGLDAIAFYPAGGVAFSCDGGAGISDGNILLPDSTRIHYTDIFTNALATAMPDPGIDGLQFTSNTSFYFSIKRDATYTGADKTISLRDADIWWTDLQTHQLVLACSREQLFAYPDYQPWLADPTVGIDAFYIWPSGEVWFSLRASWTAHTAIYSADGYGVFTDTFVFDAFKPSIDPGLDALLVMTDWVEPPPNPPTLETPASLPTLKWSATAHAYQLEAAGNVEGPYFPASPVIIDSTWSDLSSSNSALRFYRVRQW
jgi:hypothetical protein